MKAYDEKGNELPVPVGNKVLLVFCTSPRVDDGVIVDHKSSGIGRMDATVVAVGKRVVSVFSGNRIVADPSSGIQIMYDGVSYRLMDEHDILAVVEQ